jgi:hypothetical protein
VEFVDGEGNKVSVSVEGYFSQAQVNRLLEAVSHISTVNGTDSFQRTFDTDTVFGRVASLINDFSSEEWVSSSFVRDIYHKRYGEDIELPVISTYLARLNKMGLVEKKGGRNKRVYRLVKR